MDLNVIKNNALIYGKRDNEFSQKCQGIQLHESRKTLSVFVDKTGIDSTPVFFGIKQSHTEKRILQINM